MSIRRRIHAVCIAALALLLALYLPMPVFAETKQAELVTTQTTADLTVMFSFDAENVDITFLSPSGVRKTVSDPDVSCASGDLWATYRITDAEAGTWSVEYDLGRNSQIEYSIIRDDYGLWIQYLTIRELSSDGSVSAVFEADYDYGDLYYNYEIYAIRAADGEEIGKVAQGSAHANEETELSVDLSALSSGSTILRLDVYCNDDGAEIFDSMESDPFDFSNPGEPASVEDFSLYVDADNQTLTVDWEDFTEWGYDSYRLTVDADGENIYSADLDSSVTQCSVLFSSETQDLAVSLSFHSGDLWSAAKVKSLNLEEEYLTCLTEEVTGDAQAVLSYQVKEERPLYVSVNGEEGNYRVRESGTLSFNLNSGSNSIYGLLESDDLVYYVIDTSVYMDAIPPSITLYEDLDGKTFYTDSAVILGKMSGGSVLRINGEEAETEDGGEFAYEVSLSMGENAVRIEAEDVNGNTAVQALTLYRASPVLAGAADSSGGWLSFLPLMIAAALSVVIIILCILFMRKKGKDPNRMRRKRKVWLYILWDVLLLFLDVLSVTVFAIIYLTNHSMDYLEVAQQSVRDAVLYLKWETVSGVVSGCVLAVLLVSILLTALAIWQNRKIDSGK